MSSSKSARRTSACGGPPPSSPDAAAITWTRRVESTSSGRSVGPTSPRLDVSSRCAYTGIANDDHSTWSAEVTHVSPMRYGGDTSIRNPGSRDQWAACREPANSHRKSSIQL
eukprot:6459419-Pyramimonas_sp.AAC.1